MIQLSRNYSLPEKNPDPPIKIIGVGGAGSNALDRIILDGMENVEMIAMNTDVQSLAGSVATQKVQLGRSATRGLGTGGDPELGWEAAHEAAEEIRQALEGARMIFICSGLGGGTGSGAGPEIARLAREGGSLVLAFATLPFAFEGRRRNAQAIEGLRQLQETADAVVCFENDRMGDMVLPKAGIHQAFALADTTISQSVRAIVNVVRRPGLIQIGFDDLLSALRSRDSRCLFGYGESESDNRAHEALALALKNPLMDRGKMLSEARHVLVQVAGGPGMTLTEVEIVMKELGRHVEDDTQILFGTAVDSNMGERLSVTLISSLAGTEAPVAPQRTVAPVPPKVAPAPEPRPAVTPPAAMEDKSEIPLLSETLEMPVEAAPPPPPPPPAAPVEPEKKATRKEPPPSRAEPLPPKPAPKEKFVQAKQEVMQFEPVTRGRFEKSEPTIVEGQDLDVPTFLRKNVRVK